MSSPDNNPSTSASPSDQSNLKTVCERWNRKLHFYSGLFLMAFLWLFAATGLILNHPEWTFHESWRNRNETNLTYSIVRPAPELTSDFQQARDLMRQMSIEGEILWTTTHANDAPFEFQVRTPRHFYFIKADVSQGRATIRHAKVNAWGIAKILHTFTGNIANDPRNRRDGTLTAIWAYSMDFVAAGLIFMVLSSIYLWLKQPTKLIPGAVCLAVGSLLCGLFCFGLRWMF